MDVMVPEERWTDDRLDDLNKKVDDGFEGVDKRFDKVDARFEKVEGKIEGGIKELRSEMSGRLDKVDRLLYCLLTAALGVIAAIIRSNAL
jgi:tetrahydromethanopterin S-methyltransferase subunit G